MPRTVAASLLSNMLSPSPTDGIRWLLDISWNDGVNVGLSRIALHDQNVTSVGNTYAMGAFGIGLPQEGEDADVTMLRLTVQDADRAVTTELRKLDPRYPAQASLKPMLISNPDTAALAPFEGPLRNVKIGRVALAASVETFRNMVIEPAVAFAMTKAYGFNSMPQRA